MVLDKLSSNTAITLERMLFVSFSSMGRRDIPSVSVAAAS